VPTPPATGGQSRLCGISKRGESDVRTLLLHGARAPLRWGKRQTDKRSQWVRGLRARRGWHRTAVAVANQNARIVWALLTRHQDSQSATSAGAQRPVGVTTHRSLARMGAALCLESARARSPSARCEG